MNLIEDDRKKIRLRYFGSSGKWRSSGDENAGRSVEMEIGNCCNIELRTSKYGFDLNFNSVWL